MTRYRFMVESRPISGREADYHAWYDGRHTADLLNLPGAIRVERFRVVQPGGTDSFFAIVDYETDDLPGLLATIGERSQTEDMPSSDAIDRESVKITILEGWTPPSGTRRPAETSSWKNSSTP